jgi:uncharacterized membrane protein
LLVVALDKSSRVLLQMLLSIVLLDNALQQG